MAKVNRFFLPSFSYTFNTLQYIYTFENTLFIKLQIIYMVHLLSTRILALRTLNDWLIFQEVRELIWYREVLAGASYTTIWCNLAVLG